METEKKPEIFRSVNDCLFGKLDDVNVKGGFHLKGWIVNSEEPKETKKGGAYYTRFTLLDKKGQTIKATLWRKDGTYLNNDWEIELQRCVLNEYQDERGILGFLQSVMPAETKPPALKKKVVARSKDDYWEAKLQWDMQVQKEIRKMHLHNLKKDCFKIASDEINTQIDAGWYEVNEENREVTRIAINDRTMEIYSELIKEEKGEENE